MAKEYFAFTGKIPFEGKDSKNVMALIEDRKSVV